MSDFPYQIVKTIAYTQWAPELIENHKTPEDIISYCARVSNPTNQNNYDTSEKLLKYCINKKHWSIFEMSNLVLEINTTRDIARQILRHRSFHFQEFSQRYADPTKDLGFRNREFRYQDKKNRQNSLKLKASTQDQVALEKSWQRKQTDLLKLVQENYKWAIDNGMAKEQARAILPEGLTMSRMYMSGTLRDWIMYVSLRSDNGTQLEHQDLAVKCKQCILDVYPFTREIINDINTG